ncbi:MAG: hypothetical protein K8R87_14470 [Verrucomicrobia bacterium]|nr:hypothetical protein [Verrucomicrobiota bacterium]
MIIRRKLAFDHANITTLAKFLATHKNQTQKNDTMIKNKLIGATVLSAFLCSMSPVGTAMVTQNLNRTIGDNQTDSINQGNDDNGLQEMASKKKKKKKTKKKKSKAS